MTDSFYPIQMYTHFNPLTDIDLANTAFLLHSVISVYGPIINTML